MRFQAERARRAYDEAYALLPEADRRNQRAGRLTYTTELSALVSRVAEVEKLAA